MKFSNTIPLLPVMLMLICVFLSNCGIFKSKLQTIEHPRVWAGQAGEMPDEVWKYYNWVIVDSETFRAIHR